VDPRVHQEGRATNHIVVGAVASLALTFAIIIAISAYLLATTAPTALAALAVIAAFGVIVGVIDWLSERKSNGTH
jgi:high-affinity Fe2+/Pb2+ permease